MKTIVSPPSLTSSLPPKGHWESLAIGYTFDTSGRTITEADIINFACLSGDFNSLHVDAEYAKSTPFQQRIAHGLLVLSILAGLTTQSTGYRSIVPFLIALVDLHCKFLKPTFIGDTLFIRITVIDKRETTNDARGEVTFRREAINQRKEVVVRADFKMLLQREETSS